MNEMGANLRPSSRATNEATPLGRRAAASAFARVSARQILLWAGPLGVLVVAFVMYFTGGRWVSTDDFYVKRPIVSIADDVSGLVAEVDVVNNQLVKKGDPLFKLDAEPFRIALDAARAQLALATNQFAGVQASYKQALQQIDQSQADVTLASSTNQRQSALVARAASTEAALDQARHDLDTANHRLIAAQAQAKSLLAQLGGSPDLPLEQYPPYMAAKAQVDAAARNLAHTSVYAPANGVLANVDSARPGNFLQASQTAMSLGR